MKHRSAMKTALLALAPLTLLAAALPAASASEASPRTDAPAFSISALSDDDTKDVSGVSPDSATGRALEQHGYGVTRTASGETAIVDSSLLDQGLTAAYGPSFVDLSWKAYASDARYEVVRDGVRIADLDAGETAFRDTRVEPGADYDYQVVPVLPEEGHPDARMWGVKASVPSSGSLSGLRQEAVDRATAAGVAKTTTLSWVTFIPQKKINAPTAGCDYGKKFQFGGDGRTRFDWKSSKYRTALHANITWSSKKVTGSKSVRSTSVYVKKTGKKVATKTASSKNMSVKKLGSGRNYVDLRMVTHATNPFCKGLGGVKGAISGAFTIQLTTSGNYAIRSGKHRLMPNHHIYIYDGGKVTNVYTRSYASASCLIGSIACPEADLTGRYGRF
ncbi:hypothetical protein [Streptomyces sp. JJ38]|uniref:hypothetical protein n=1 Tax=Streptomyces sp. JJ38 TaxID=2738128 RepID=UPI001C5A4B48|nr:hypothetical protein [Streptomyces sp. JJ38]MBW1598656.1 hypothetical protein [Streptomyces sp. JJ38]